MIEFKQWDSWGNNFNNWDEAKLSDSTRPRDEFWFKIKPWMQSDKWDFRSSNKNIYLDQCVVRWARTVTWNDTYYNDNTWALISLYTDLKWNTNIWTFTHKTAGWNVTYTDDIIQQLETYKIWSLSWQCKDWKLIIPESWSYFINYYVEFLYDANHNVSSSYKNLAYLYTNAKWWWPYAIAHDHQFTYEDNCWWVTIQDLKQWEELSLWVMHNQTWTQYLCVWTIIIMKLS